MLFATFIASITFGVWVGVYAWFGEPSKLDSGIVTFLGGVLAISGLLFRQYMLKEVLDYLKTWDRMSVLLRIIIDTATGNGHADDTHVKALEIQKAQAHRYSNYVRLELSLVPIVPILLIFLYGCTVLSERSLILRESCLFLMIFCVSYLAIAAISSTRLACAHPDLEEAINDLNKLRQDLVKNKDYPTSEKVVF
jgi:hypothetical protein